MTLLKNQTGNEAKKLSLPPAQRKVYNLFMEGGMYSAADISIRLHVCDPRGIIRDLRHSGVEVSDIWIKGMHGVRFKRYFIHFEKPAQL